MSFQAKTGCPMCSIVSTALHAPSNSPRAPNFPVGSTQPEVLWRDDNFTAYREKQHPVSSKGHIIIAFNLHVPSIYTLSSSDLPLLVNVRNLATRLLQALLPPSSPKESGGTSHEQPLNTGGAELRIGFITPPFRDSKIPITDHLHAHAYIGPPDLMGWWRAVGFGPLAWYAIEDLIAEIRESVSNNRVKSGYTNRPKAPIDMVPQAGARAGTANGVETSEPGLASPDLDLEDGDRSPTSSIQARLLSNSPSPIQAIDQIPSIRV